MNALVLSNRRRGPERVLELGEDRAPNATLSDAMAGDELDTIAERYRGTARFDVETLHAAPSWDIGIRGGP